MKHVFLVTVFLLLLLVPIFPEDVTVYVTPTGSTYHTRDCRHYSDSCISLPLSEALYSGYRPCRSCLPPVESEQEAPVYTVEPLALPLCDHPEDIIHYKGFSLLYSEEHEQPAWVAYLLTADEERLSLPRPNNFRPDPNIATDSATQDDYDDAAYVSEPGVEPSKYARGHLAPHADMDWDFIAVSQSYLYSNMSPQVPEFNGSGGLWYRLEAWQRKQAAACGGVYIVSGPVLTDGPYREIGPNGVDVPLRYYKVILDFLLPDIKAVGFIVPNEVNSMSIFEFAVPVNEVETLTGLDFFPLLDDELEESLESSVWGGNLSEN